jgi:GTP-binding protein YchF
MQIGFVGLQHSGKTTLFNTITKREISDSFSNKEEASIEVVKIPDERLDKMNAIFKPPKKVNATIEIYDTPGLKTSEDGRVKITSSFLNNVRNNDALFYVIRQFNDDSVSHPLNRIDPAKDIEFLESEFIFSDLAFFEKRIEKVSKDLSKTKDDKLKRELPLLEKCNSNLEMEIPLRNLSLDENELKLLSGFQLLTLKPLIIGINFDENSAGKIPDEIRSLQNKFQKSGAEIIPFLGKLEYEISKMSEEDAKEFMSDYGIKESALDKILRTSYKVLGLQSFFTVGEDECRAWTIKKNYTAQQAAGVIHTDFFNKFIRAEVVHYDDFMKYGSFAKCKEAGAWRLEGKEYIVKDGDILNIRHN